jgi:hypothetical protein
MLPLYRKLTSWVWEATRRNRCELISEFLLGLPLDIAIEGLEVPYRDFNGGAAVTHRPAPFLPVPLFTKLPLAICTALHSNYKNWEANVLLAECPT